MSAIDALVEVVVEKLRARLLEEGTEMPSKNLSVMSWQQLHDAASRAFEELGLFGQSGSDFPQTLTDLSQRGFIPPKAG